jgi:hypothetical protein
MANLAQLAIQGIRSQQTHKEKDLLIHELRRQLRNERIARVIAQGKLRLLQLSKVQLSLTGSVIGANHG